MSLLSYCYEVFERSRNLGQGLTLRSTNFDGQGLLDHSDTIYDYDKAICLTRNHVTQGDGMNASVLSRSTSWSEYIQKYIQVVRMLWASGMRRALEVRHMSTEWKVLPGGKCMKLYNVEWHWYRV